MYAVNSSLILNGNDTSHYFITFTNRCRRSKHIQASITFPSSMPFAFTSTHIWIKSCVRTIIHSSLQSSGIRSLQPNVRMAIFTPVWHFRFKCRLLCHLFKIHRIFNFACVDMFYHFFHSKRILRLYIVNNSLMWNRKLLIYVGKGQNPRI